MNNRIKELQDMLESSNRNGELIKAKIQKEYDKVFNDSKELSKAILFTEQSSMYQVGEYGDIESWYRAPILTDYVDCKEYLEAWISDNYCLRVDWENDCLVANQGEGLIIQDDARNKRDNGVWLNSKCVIKESEYNDADTGEVDEVKRNSLIETYMETTGYFPGVFRVDYHGNVSSVNTKGK